MGGVLAGRVDDKVFSIKLIDGNRNRVYWGLFSAVDPSPTHPQLRFVQGFGRFRVPASTSVLVSKTEFDSTGGGRRRRRRRKINDLRRQIPVKHQEETYVERFMLQIRLIPCQCEDFSC